ncbi:glutathione S-transferase [Rhizobium sp. XQZ8]|uniref:glutathione S-transferase family protein n=1 Tax=Rhizobium populisoli TaxID=2859785 RepID=UPI001C67E667|nr:glutathione S-transferase [Rhizobium populisoli]MBW6424835.1 glutathione S-transferase [Rhizobium populisoli]
MLIVHHLNNSRSQRILWMLEELGLEYEIRTYKRNRDMSAPAEMKRVHPLGKSPILEDRKPGGDVTVLVETGAICEYLVGKAGGRLRPPDGGQDLLFYRQFLHSAEGSVMPVLFTMLVLSKVPIVGRVMARRVRPMLDIHLDYAEGELAARSWFAGNEISAADIMMSFPLEAAQSRGLVGEERPNIKRWLQQIHARPAYKRALARGGPYSFAEQS